jgi:hypothetical protein
MELHQLELKLKGTDDPESKRRRREIAILNDEINQLSNEIETLEQKDAEINENMRHMSETAEMTIRQRQQANQQRRNEGQADDLNQQMQPAPLDDAADNQ